DKIQHVGFSFHDRVSTGQLINRALTDLQNVRSFIQTALLVTMEIGLIVGGYIILIFTLNPWLALVAAMPLPFWTWYILRFGKRVQPAGKAVMEAEEQRQHPDREHRGRSRGQGIRQEVAGDREVQRGVRHVLRQGAG